SLSTADHIRTPARLLSTSASRIPGPDFRPRPRLPSVIPKISTRRSFERAPEALEAAGPDAADRLAAPAEPGADGLEGEALGVVEPEDLRLGLGQVGQGVGQEDGQLPAAGRLARAGLAQRQDVEQPGAGGAVGVGGAAEVPGGVQGQGRAPGGPLGPTVVTAPGGPLLAGQPPRPTDQG